MKLSRIISLGLSALALAACAGGGAADLTPEQLCHVGAYRLSDGRVLDVAPADGPNLRWRLENGETGRLDAAGGWSGVIGWTEKPDPRVIRFGGCDHGRITFAAGDGETLEGRRIDLVTRETTFRSGDVELFGRLVLPPGDGPVPVVVQVHGSEKDAATVYNFRQRLYAGQGVGVFVYDKRGTGRSTGAYTQDFQLLARDAAEAAKTARRLAGPRGGRIGFEGGSQGGWVAPLAASLTPVDFVVVGYGLADTPAAENRDEALQDLAAAGYTDPAIRAKALEVIAATDAVMQSGFRSGYDKLDEVRRKYGKEPWFEHVTGEYTGELLKYPNWAIRIVGPRRDVRTPWAYDPLPVLRAQTAPLLWVLAGDDTSAPPEVTRRRLKALASEGAPITAIEFPETEHNILEFETDEDGERRETRYAEGYFRAVLDWARDGRLSGPYGRAVGVAGQELTPAPASPSPEATTPGA